MPVKVQIIFYSMYGHIYRMAEAILEGAREVANVEVELYRVPEIVPDSMLEQSGAKTAQQLFAHIPIITPEILSNADACVFGAPTRFGNMCTQMRHFLDTLNDLWAKNALFDKIGSVFTSSGTQHSGQQTAITSFHSTLFHLGMTVVGVPYIEKRLIEMDAITGRTLADGKRMPTENELAIARYQGRQVAEITRALCGHG